MLQLFIFRTELFYTLDLLFFAKLHTVLQLSLLYYTGVGKYTMGNDDMPGRMNVCMIMSCYCLWKAFDSKSYLLNTLTGLKITNQWRKGGGVNVLRGKGEKSKEVMEFRECLRCYTNTSKGIKMEEEEGEEEHQPSADAILNAIREVEELFPINNTCIAEQHFKKSCVPSTILLNTFQSKLQVYYTVYQNKWVDLILKLFGYVQTKEHKHY